MPRGSERSRSKRRVQVRAPSGETRQRYVRRAPSKPTCPSGRPLPGTARGTKTQVNAMSKTERRPSRPYGGVLSSPVMRSVMVERAASQFTEDGAKGHDVGAVCVKIAGRDAGKLCVVTEVIDGQFVKVDGFTRPRKVSTKHLEPIGKKVELKKGASSADIQKLLSA